MQSQLYYLSLLNMLDRQMDELEEEYGDLPQQVRNLEEKTGNLKTLYNETGEILKEINAFCSSSKIAIEEMRLKEEELSKLQFQVRNNKEFDAITKQIEYLKIESRQLNEKISTESVKEENLVRLLDEQKANYNEALAEYAVKKKELKFITSDQNDEITALQEKRELILKSIEKQFLVEYNRIRNHLKDAVVLIRKNSCSGCFSSVPPQKIVEIRTDMNTTFTCENCGRILYPEELEIKESDLDKL